MRIVFMGTPESAVPSLRQCLADGHDIVAVWTQPDKPVGRHQTLHASPVKEFALKQKLPVHQPAKIKTDEAKALFASHAADVAVVVAYGRILPAEFLSAPREGCVNVHFSLLPKYRGAAPVNWAIVNGEQETGVTTMRVVEELDAGPILLQRSTEIDNNETAPELMNRLAEIGADLLSETLGRLREIQGREQKESEVTFAPILKRENGLIDWSMDAHAVERRVRGFQPWPNAHTLLESKRLIVWTAKAEDVDNDSAECGKIEVVHGDNLIVACGAGTHLRISELQLEGKRRMTSREFINGSHIRSGIILK